MKNKDTFVRLFCEYTDGTKSRFEFLKKSRSPTQKVFDTVNREERYGESKLGSFIGDEMIVGRNGDLIKLKNILDPLSVGHWIKI